MSKAFTREDDENTPSPSYPLSPSLPEGQANYITLEGAARLRGELRGLEAELAAGGEPERRILADRARALRQRVETLVVVEPPRSRVERVVFGARVTVRDEAGRERSFEIVGVDEACAADGRVSFTAPLARAVLGAREGDVVEAITPRGAEGLLVVRIAPPSERS